MKIAGKHSSEGVAGFGDLKLIPILQIVWLEQRAVQAMGQGCRITESKGKDLNPGSRDAEPTILTHCAHPLHCLSTCPWGHQGSEDKGNTRQEHSDALGPEPLPEGPAGTAAWCSCRCLFITGAVQTGDQFSQDNQASWKKRRSIFVYCLPRPGNVQYTSIFEKFELKDKLWVSLKVSCVHFVIISQCQSNAVCARVPRLHPLFPAQPYFGRGEKNTHHSIRVF